MGRFAGFVVSTPAGMVPAHGGDVRGLGRYGFADIASQSSDPIELRRRLTAMIDSLASTWAWAKAQILVKNFAAKWIAGIDTSIAGLTSIDNLIALKRQSINDVLAGQTPVGKWVNGVEVARAEIANYVKYVNGNASAMANLSQLGTDLKTTAADYGATFVQAAKLAGVGLSLATFGVFALAGVILWKAGPDILRAWASPPRLPLRGYSRRRRR